MARLNGNKILTIIRTKETSSGAIDYTTTAPSSNNTNGLKMCVLTTDPSTKYSGWLYIITQTPSIILKVYLGSQLIYQRTEKLSTPSISLSGSVISWTAINHANSYYIYVDGTYENYTSGTSYNLENLLSTPGTYAIRVKAHSNDANYDDSNLSNTVYYTIDPPTPPTPTEEVTVRWTLSCSTSGGVTDYQCGGRVLSVTSGLDINLVSLGYPSGSSTITFTGSVGDGQDPKTESIVVYYNGSSIGTKRFEIAYGDNVSTTEDRDYGVET